MSKQSESDRERAALGRKAKKMLADAGIASRYMAGRTILQRRSNVQVYVFKDDHDKAKQLLAGLAVDVSEDVDEPIIRGLMDKYGCSRRDAENRLKAGGLPW